MSKHHYAEALARRGNEVYFLEPGNLTSKKVSLNKLEENLTIVNYPLKARGWGKLPGFLFRLLIGIEIRNILKAGIPVPDVVWCFDPLRAVHLGSFKKAITIYHPVDQFGDSFLDRYSVKPHLVFSSMKKETEKMRRRGWNAFFLHHGLAGIFAQKAAERIQSIDNGSFKNESGRQIRVGFSGNLLGEASDREVMKKIIESNADCEFHFWGKIKNEDSYINLGNHHPEFLDFLNSQNNVKVHGVVNTQALAEGLFEMNMLWMIWKTNGHKQWNEHTNPHKVMEYLACGVPAVTHYMHTYADLGLLHMAPVNAGQEDIIRMFTRVKDMVHGISLEKEKVKARIEFALSHTYDQLLHSAEEIINDMTEANHA